MLICANQKNIYYIIITKNVPVRYDWFSLKDNQVLNIFFCKNIRFINVCILRC